VRGAQGVKVKTAQHGIRTARAVHGGAGCCAWTQIRHLLGLAWSSGLTSSLPLEAAAAERGRGAYDDLLTFTSTARRA
jgi:hypothetical protein